MRYYKQFWIFPALIFCLTAVHVSVHAEVLTPEGIVSHFNGGIKPATNGPYYPGFVFATPSGGGDVIGREELRKLEFQPRDGNSIDAGAYTNIENDYGGVNGGGWITTFRVFRDDTELTAGHAWLGYNSNNGKTYSGYADPEKSQDYLTLGTAYLYSQFVQGNLQQIEVRGAQGLSTQPWNAELFRNALDILYKSKSASNTEWENPYLTYLLSLTPSNPTTPDGDFVVDWKYWTSDYVLTYDYDGLDKIGFGDYYVFVMNVWESAAGQPSQGAFASMLYAISKGSDPPPTPGVPEPATLILWTLGGLGLGGTSWLRRRNMKRLFLH